MVMVVIYGKDRQSSFSSTMAGCMRRFVANYEYSIGSSKDFASNKVHVRDPFTGEEK